MLILVSSKTGGGWVSIVWITTVTPTCTLVSLSTQCWLKYSFCICPCLYFYFLFVITYQFVYYIILVLDDFLHLFYSGMWCSSCQVLDYSFSRIVSVLVPCFHLYRSLSEAVLIDQFLVYPLCLFGTVSDFGDDSSFLPFQLSNSFQ